MSLLKFRPDLLDHRGVSRAAPQWRGTYAKVAELFDLNNTLIPVGDEISSESRGLLYPFAQVA